jgi:hypothetical protein
LFFELIDKANTDFSHIPPSQLPAILKLGTFLKVRLVYPQLTARELSIMIQSISLQAASRGDLKVRGFF